MVQDNDMFYHDRIRYELFELILPKLIYEDIKKKDFFIFNSLHNDGGGFIFTLYNALCSDDGSQCPYTAEDFDVGITEENGFEILQINLPSYNTEITNIVRAYCVFNKKIYEKEDVLILKYFLIRHVPGGQNFILYIPPRKECVKSELPEKNDLSHEHWKLIQTYLIVSAKELEKVFSRQSECKKRD